MNDVFYWMCGCGHINEGAFNAFSGPPLGKPMTCARCKNTDPFPQWATNIEAFQLEFPHKQYPHRKFGGMGYGNVANEIKPESITDEETFRLAPIGEEWRKYTLEHPSKQEPIRPIEEIAELEFLKNEISSLRTDLKISKKISSNERTKDKRRLQNFEIKMRKLKLQNKLTVDDRERLAQLEIEFNELRDVWGFKSQYK